MKKPLQDWISDIALTDNERNRVLERVPVFMRCFRERHPDVVNGVEMYGEEDYSDIDIVVTWSKMMTPYLG